MEVGLGGAGSLPAVAPTASSWRRTRRLRALVRGGRSAGEAGAVANALARHHAVALDLGTAADGGAGSGGRAVTRLAGRGGAGAGGRRVTASSVQIQRDVDDALRETTYEMNEEGVEVVARSGARLFGGPSRSTSDAWLILGHGLSDGGPVVGAIIEPVLGRQTAVFGEVDYGVWQG
eukprot:4430166-Alexandrium_andersonii.AAC.1